MTTPEDHPQVFDGTDIEVDPSEIEAEADIPATTDPEELSDDGSSGGVGGQGGAG